MELIAITVKRYTKYLTVVTQTVVTQTAVILFTVTDAAGGP